MSHQSAAFRRPPPTWDRPLLSRAAPVVPPAGVATVPFAQRFIRCPQCVVSSTAPAHRPWPACGPCCRHRIPTPPPACARVTPRLIGARDGPLVPLVASTPTAAPAPPIRRRRCVAHSSHVFPHVPCVVLTPLQPHLVSSPCEETIAWVPSRGYQCMAPETSASAPLAEALLSASLTRGGADAVRGPPANRPPSPPCHHPTRRGPSRGGTMIAWGDHRVGTNAKGLPQRPIVAFASDVVF